MMDVDEGRDGDVVVCLLRCEWEKETDNRDRNSRVVRSPLDNKEEASRSSRRGKRKEGPAELGVFLHWLESFKPTIVWEGR